MNCKTEENRRYAHSKVMQSLTVMQKEKNVENASKMNFKTIYSDLVVYLKETQEFCPLLFLLNVFSSRQ